MPLLRLRSLSLLCLLIAFLVGDAAGADNFDIDSLAYRRGITSTIEEYDAGGFTIRVDNTNAEVPTEGTSRVTSIFFLAGPPGTTIELENLDLSWSVYIDGEREGPLTLNDRSETFGEVPRNFTRIMTPYVDTWRSVALFQFHLPITIPLTVPGSDGKKAIATLESARFKASFGGEGLNTPVEPVDLSERDPLMLQMGPLLIANAEQLPMLTRAVADIADLERVQNWTEVLKGGLAEGPVAMFRVDQPGVYALKPQDLMHLGLDPAAFNPTRLRLFAGDHELPIVIERPADGPFVGDTEVVFYAPPREFPRTSYTPIWLMNGDHETEENRAARRLTDVNIRLGAADAPTADVHTIIDLFRPDVFDARHPFSEESGRWAITHIAKGDYFELAFMVEGLRTDTPGEFALEFGTLAAPDNAECEAFLNGTALGGTGNMAGVGPHKKTFAIPPGVLKEGTNRVTLRFPERKETPQGDTLVLSGAKVRVPLNPARLPANTEIVLTGPAEKDVSVTFPREAESYRTLAYLLDTTNPLKPLRLTARSTTTPKREHAFTSWVSTGNSPRRLYFADSASVRYPGNARLYTHDELLAPEEGADQLVIVHDDTIAGMGEYIRHRKAQGLDTRIVNVESAYAVFDFGYKRYQALADLVQHAFVSWPGRRLSGVLLVGEASEYWWEIGHPNPSVSPNQVPVFGFADPNVTVRSDDAYGIIGNPGTLTDIEVGRIPSRDYDQTAGTVLRLLTYEISPPAGPWETRHVMVTDDEPEFRRVAERVIGSQMAGTQIPQRVYLQTFPYEDYFRIYRRKRSNAATEAIIDAMSRGSLTITYYGHGGPNLWSGERIFHYRDIARLNSEGRRPIMAAASCDTAWVDYPVDPVKESLAEQFLLSPNGGTTAVFAPVAGTSSFEHDYLIRAFYEGLIYQKLDRLGLVTSYARLRYMLERNQKYVSNQFVLLGDPQTRIPSPGDRLAMTVNPGQMFANQRTPIAIEGRAERITWGKATAMLLDASGETIAGPANAPVRNGAFSLSIPVPDFLPSGTHRLIVQAYNESAGQFDTRSATFEVREPEVSIDWHIDPPVASGLAAGTVLDVEVLAANRSEGFMDNLVLTLRDVAVGQDLTSRPLSIPATGDVSWKFRLPAPPGVTILEARAEYAERASTQLPVATKSVEILAHAAELPMVAVPSRAVEIERLAAPPSTTFSIPLYNLGVEPLTNLSAELLLMDRDTGTSVGGRVQAGTVPALGKAQMIFTSNTRFPEGMLRFTLRITCDGRPGEAERRQDIPLTVEVPSGADLLVVPGSVHTERRDYVVGETVFVRARISNRGALPVRDVKTSLYINSPWWDRALATSAVGDNEIVLDEPLQPGEVRDLRLRWDPPTGGIPECTVYVVVNSDRRHPETDFVNNVQGTDVHMTRLPNLALDVDGLRSSQRYLQAGDVVGFTIPFANVSEFDFAHPFVVEVRAQGEGVPDELIFRGGYEGMDAGEASTIQVAWRADGIRDAVVVNVNEDREFGESTEADNRKRIPFEYAFNQKFLEVAKGRWDMASTLAQGTTEGVFRAPDGTLQLLAYPAKSVDLPVDNEWVVGDPLPKQNRLTDADNLMAILPYGAIGWTPYEEPEPVQLRMRTPQDDRSTLYDVYFDTGNPQSRDGKPTNFLRYRLENAPEWKQIRRPTSFLQYAGRVETRDDWLDLELAPLSTPSWTTIYRIEVRPVEGSYTSPLYEIPGLRPGRLVADVESEGESRIDFEFRVGTGDRRDPQLGPWTPMKIGEPLPISGDQWHTFQWRCFLVGGQFELPIIKSVGFDFNPPSTEVARSNP